jgi:hypothetical protein
MGVLGAVTNLIHGGSALPALPSGGASTSPGTTTPTGTPAGTSPAGAPVGPGLPPPQPITTTLATDAVAAASGQQPGGAQPAPTGPTGPIFWMTPQHNTPAPVPAPSPLATSVPGGGGLHRSPAG